MTETVARISAGVNKDQFEKVGIYLNISINNKIPVLVGVDDQQGAANGKSIDEVRSKMN